MDEENNGHFLPSGQRPNPDMNSLCFIILIVIYLVRNRIAVPTWREMRFGVLRQLTFYNFPRTDRDTRDFVEAGFYYSGIRDIVICHSCGLSIENFSRTDNILHIHRRLSSQCRYLCNYDFERRQTVEYFQRRTVGYHYVLGLRERPLPGPSRYISVDDLRGSIVGLRRVTTLISERVEIHDSLPDANLPNARVQISFLTIHSFVAYPQQHSVSWYDTGVIMRHYSSNFSSRSEADSLIHEVIRDAYINHQFPMQPSGRYTIQHRRNTGIVNAETNHSDDEIENNGNEQHFQPAVRNICEFDINQPYSDETERKLVVNNCNVALDQSSSNASQVPFERLTGSSWETLNNSSLFSDEQSHTRLRQFDITPADEFSDGMSIVQKVSYSHLENAVENVTSAEESILRMSDQNNQVVRSEMNNEMYESVPDQNQADARTDNYEYRRLEQLHQEDRNNMSNPVYTFKKRFLKSYPSARVDETEGNSVEKENLNDSAIPLRNIETGCGSVTTELGENHSRESPLEPRTNEAKEDGKNKVLDDKTNSLTVISNSIDSAVRPQIEKTIESSHNVVVSNNEETQHAQLHVEHICNTQEHFSTLEVLSVNKPVMSREEIENYENHSRESPLESGTNQARNDVKNKVIVDKRNMCDPSNDNRITFGSNCTDLANITRSEQTLDCCKAATNSDCTQNGQPLDCSKVASNVDGTQNEQTLNCSKVASKTDGIQNGQPLDCSKVALNKDGTQNEQTLDCSNVVSKTNGNQNEQMLDCSNFASNTDGTQNEQPLDSSNVASNTDDTQNEQTLDCSNFASNTDDTQNVQPLDCINVASITDGIKNEQTLDCSNFASNTDGTQNTQPLECSNVASNTDDTQNEQTLDCSNVASTTDGNKNKQTLDCSNFASKIDGTHDEQPLEYIKVALNTDGTQKEQTLECSNVASKTDGTKNEQPLDCSNSASNTDSSQNEQPPDCSKVASNSDGTKNEQTLDCSNVASNTDGTQNEQTLNCSKIASNTDGTQNEQTLDCSNVASNTDDTQNEQTLDCSNDASNTDGTQNGQPLDCSNVPSNTDGSQNEKPPDCSKVASNTDGTQNEQPPDRIKVTSYTDGNQNELALDSSKVTSNTDGSKTEQPLDFVKVVSNTDDTQSEQPLEHICSTPSSGIQANIPNLEVLEGDEPENLEEEIDPQQNIETSTTYVQIVQGDSHHDSQFLPISNRDDTDGRFPTPDVKSKIFPSNAGLSDTSGEDSPRHGSKAVSPREVVTDEDEIETKGRSRKKRRTGGVSVKTEDTMESEVKSGLAISGKRGSKNYQGFTYECKFCHAVYEDVIQVVKHLKTVHQGYGFICLGCKRTFQNKGAPHVCRKTKVIVAYNKKSKHRGAEAEKEACNYENKLAENDIIVHIAKRSRENFKGDKKIYKSMKLASNEVKCVSSTQPKTNAVIECNILNNLKRKSKLSGKEDSQEEKAVGGKEIKRKKENSLTEESMQDKTKITSSYERNNRSCTSDVKRRAESDENDIEEERCPNTVDVKKNVKLIEEHNKGMIKLNVGGKDFRTSKVTLFNSHDSVFPRILGQNSSISNQENGIFFDRDPLHFGFILNYLRNGCKLPKVLFPADKVAICELLIEAEFYNIKELITELNKISENIESDMDL